MYIGDPYIDESSVRSAFERVQGEKDPLERSLIALQPELEITFMEALLYDPDEIVLSALAQNHRLPGRLLEKLSQGNPHVRRLVASHPNCPYGLLESFLYDEEKVKEGLAMNPKLPLEIAEELIEEGISVRQHLASNRSLTEELLIDLLADDSDRVAYEALANPSLPLRILKKFSKRREYFHQKGVLSNPATTSEMIEEIKRNPTEDIYERNKLRLLMADHSNTPSQILEELYEQSNHNLKWDLHYYIARNPNIPSSVLNDYLRNGNNRIALALTSNNSISATDLFAIAEDPENRGDEVVQERVKNHPNYNFENYAEEFAELEEIES